jgi:hypothetical protein
MEATARDQIFYTRTPKLTSGVTTGFGIWAGCPRESCARPGGQALDRLSEDAADLIADWMIPVLDGPGLLRARWPRTKTSGTFPW